MHSNPLSLSKFENSQNEKFRDIVFQGSSTVPISESTVFHVMYDNKSEVKCTPKQKAQKSDHQVGWGVNSQGTPENNKEVFLYFFLDYFVWGDHKTFAIFRPGFDSWMVGFPSTHFGTDGWKSNQPPVECPSTGWISIQWLEFHPHWMDFQPHGWKSNH